MSRGTDKQIAVSAHLNCRDKGCAVFRTIHQKWDGGEACRIEVEHLKSLACAH